MKRKRRMTVRTSLPVSSWRLFDLGIPFTSIVRSLTDDLMLLHNVPLIKQHHDTIDRAIAELRKLERKGKRK